ncbi:hypothetical protein OHS33_20970 [Streptomyces sp. NBC_00536]|uniref:hypothetical protein n=1 Tax=Streptomyces sp. NBC_00536 TaxID=2975769 RepID=UPI002E81DC48|nr:hypothetical protein [Streptomyces sp. NBC_00536]WUC80574.1 hypothetical protein OHS33_20970 [Streptomyces sp. NBC_00536]
MPAILVIASLEGHPGITRADNDVRVGIQSVSSVLGAGLLRVHRSCTGLLDEIPSLSLLAQAQVNAVSTDTKVPILHPD